MTDMHKLLRIMREADAADREATRVATEAQQLHTVYCSQCGGEFKNKLKTGFSHCANHKGMKNYDLAEQGAVEGLQGGKTEHSGPKKGLRGGAYRGRTQDAKRDSNKNRRSADKSATKVGEAFGAPSSNLSKKSTAQLQAYWDKFKDEEGIGPVFGQQMRAINRELQRRKGKKPVREKTIYEDYGSTSPMSGVSGISGGSVQDDSVSFTRTKTEGEASVTVSAHATNMEELHAMLKLAGINVDVQHTDDTQVAVQPEQPEVSGIEPEPEVSPCQGGIDKESLLDKLRQSLQQKFNL